jgi:ubiquinone/menaquinone biosynthesis C-methylase UbiE
MSQSKRQVEYHLGYTDAEHERLICQANRLAPVTERLFREAGIGKGQRVLDVGSGVGDVAMLAARIVGPSGKVVAIERDAGSIARARTRAADAGLRNIDFVESDINDFATETLFDAAVGRYVLQFLLDPVASLRSVAKMVQPGGVIAFQEGSWLPFLALSAHLPLWYATISLLRDAAARNGVNSEMGPELHRAFQEAGLPAPHMRLEMELGCDSYFTRMASDCMRSILPQLPRLNLGCENLGNLDTLADRLQKEVADSNSVVPWIGLVAAWCRKPSL